MKVMFIALLLVVSSTSFAERKPMSSGNDPRIRTVAYSPLDVVSISAYFGIGTTIQFDPSEVIEDKPVMGMTAAWEVIPKPHGRVVLKPTVESGHTNLTIFTNKRTYNFELKAVRQGKRGIDDSKMTYMLFFSYPEETNRADYNKYFEEVVKEKQALAKCSTTESGLVDPTSLDYNYQFSGSPEIAPIVAFDDGEFIYLQFSKNTPIPSAFSVDRGNNETTLNTRIQGRDYLVIEQLASRITLRHGDQVVTVIKGDRNIEIADKSKGVSYDGW